MQLPRGRHSMRQLRAIFANLRKRYERDSNHAFSFAPGQGMLKSVYEARRDQAQKFRQIRRSGRRVSRRDRLRAIIESSIGPEIRRTERRFMRSKNPQRRAILQQIYNDQTDMLRRLLQRGGFE